MSNSFTTAGLAQTAMRHNESLSSLHEGEGGSPRRPQSLRSGQGSVAGEGSMTQQPTGNTPTSWRRLTATVSMVSNEVRTYANCAAYVAIIVAMAGAAMFGADQTNYGLVQDWESFYNAWCEKYTTKADGSFHCEDGGWTTFISLGGSLITVGAAFGCVTVGPIVSSKCGRRACISTGGIICFLGCLFASYFSATTKEVYYVGRFVTGFGVGICCFALPMYSSEVATPGIRGLMGSLFQFMVVVGGLIATLVLKVLSSGGGDWKFGMLLPGICGATVAVFIWFAPESPRFVMDKAGYEAGLAMLQRVRKGDCESEAREMQAESEREAEAGQVSYRELFSERNRRRRVFTACYLQIAQQLTGVNAFLSYQSTIFEEAGIHHDFVPTMAIYFNLLMMAGCIAGLLCIDSAMGGRRRQLIFATCLMGPPLVIAGIGKLSGWPQWISMAAIVLYGPGFQFAWGIVPWLYPAEIFSMNEKDKAVSLATNANFVINFLITIITPPLLKASAGGTFVMYGLLNVANLIFVLVCVKETKGVPLEQVTALFGEGFTKPGGKKLATRSLTEEEQ